MLKVFASGTEPVVLDGSQGEGGGQVLRSALACSLLTGRPLRMTRIRAERKRPGLLRQHLASVQAATVIGNSRIMGDELGAMDLEFAPRQITHGDYHFDIGSAGSTMLVVQTVIIPLLWQSGKTTIVLEGGTHNPMAPAFDFIAHVFFPLLRKMGAHIDLELERPGFFPAGGGKVKVTIEGGHELQPLHLHDRGKLLECRARVYLSRLPRHVGERELALVSRELGWSPGQVLECQAAGPGNVICGEIVSENCTEVVAAFGAKGKPAESVARELVREAKRYLESAVPVGEHLADQLMLPMALAGGSFQTGELSLHATTNLEVLAQFLSFDSVLTPNENGILAVFEPKPS
jgi:RNA 3'-terminal phosphate cyclase (ATP)